MKTNDEARMTNDEIIAVNGKSGPGRPPRVRSFGLRRSSVIRHSSLVICLLAAAFVLAACNSSKTLTKENVNQVAEGMAKKQVESILGPPTTIDSKDFVLLKKTVYIYSQGKESVTVVFKDDKVQSTTSTLSE
jgi:hypothetical protein